MTTGAGDTAVGQDARWRDVAAAIFEFELAYGHTNVLAALKFTKSALRTLTTTGVPALVFGNSVADGRGTS